MFRGPAEDAPAGIWIRHSGRPGHVFRVTGRVAKDGSIWTRGGDKDPKGHRAAHAIPGDTHVVEVPNPQQGGKSK